MAVDPNLTAEQVFPALVQQESGGRAGVEGPQTQYGRAIGRTQMLPATAREMATKLGVPYREELLRGTSPEASAYQDRLGMAYFQQGLETTGNMRDALMYYHGGPDRSIWGPKTRAYADSVLRRVQGGDFAPVSGGEATSPTQAPPDVAALSDADLLALAGGGETAAQAGTQQNPIDLANLAESDIPLLKQGAYVRNGEEVYALPGDAFQQQPQAGDQAAGDGVYVRRPNLTDTVGNFAMAAGEQIPFLDEAATAAGALMKGTDFSTERENYLRTQRLGNQTDRGARVAGGLAGFGASLFTPGAGAAGQWINAGNRVQRLARAGTVGAVGAGLFGAGAAEGGLLERAEAGRNSALFGYGAGAVGQRAIGALDSLAQQAASRAPTDARLLSRMGVDLTPGQMTGGLLKRVEDGLTSVPILGDAIRGAQRRTLESFDNTAINRALEPVGETLTAAQSAGRQGMVNARAVEREAYNTALQNVAVDVADETLGQAFGNIRRAAGLTRDVRSSLNSTLDNILEQADGVIDGDTWKRVDSQLAAAARAAGKGADSAPEKAALRDRLTEARQAWRDLLGRTDEAALEAVSNADAASAALRIVRKASSDVGSAARGGDASPQTLNRAVAASGADGGAGYSQGSRLLQDLTDPAMRVLPSSVPDSGTPLRSLLSVGGIGGGAAMAGANPAIPAAIIAGLGIASTAYGRTAQNLANRAFRASDTGGGRALQDLAELATQRPVLIPYYEAVLAALRPDSQSQSQTNPQARPSLLSPSPAA